MNIWTLAILQRLLSIIFGYKTLKCGAISLSPEIVIKLLAEYEGALLTLENRIPIELNIDWVNRLPKGAGVYVIFDYQSTVYVGETGSLRGRMRDLRDTRNHTLRRSVGATKFTELNGYEKATSSKKYASHIEKLLDEVICKMYVKLIEVDFGRKEIEEHLIAKHNPVYNRRVKRV